MFIFYKHINIICKINKAQRYTFNMYLNVGFRKADCPITNSFLIYNWCLFSQNFKILEGFTYIVFDIYRAFLYSSSISISLYIEGYEINVNGIFEDSVSSESKPTGYDIILICIQLYSKQPQKLRQIRNSLISFHLT